MAEQRLPVVNGDDGTWGDILRQYIKKEHYDDGTNNPVNGGHQNVTIRPGTATAAPLTLSSGTNLTTPVAGAMEFTTDTLYFTITTGTVRKKVALYDDTGVNGDLYYKNAAGAFVRIPVGSSSQVLGVSGGVPAWGAVPTQTFNTATAAPGTTYTIGASDTVVFANASTGNVTVTLPTASSMTGYRFYVKRIDNSANTVTVNVTGGGTIDGMTSFTVDLQYTAFEVVSNGSAWYIL